MGTPIFEIFKYALLSTVGILAGGLLALYRPPGPWLRGFLLYFSAGVIISVVAVEILPDIVRRHAPWQVALGFSLGVALMFSVKHFSEKLETKTTGEASLPWGIIVAGGIDEMLDGLLLGIGFAVGQKEGILLSCGLAVEVFTFSLAVTATLRSKNISRSKTFGAITVMAACFLIGTLLGITFLKGLSSEMLEFILSFGLAALLYLVTDELLAEAHEMEETPGMTVAFFGGFLIFLILGMVA